MKVAPHKYRKWLEDKCDRLYSEYTRRRDKGKCFTCPVQRHWKEMTCGHFIQRSVHALRWDLNNGRCQCDHCNSALGGNPKIFKEKLIEQVGEKEVERLVYTSKRVKKFTIDALVQIKEQFTNLLKRYESN